ncbi:hypothetical protein [Streptomyces sp. NBC_00162]|uniref:hypothetical protein n=1 Tax=Streptomyces sp. NBC_00162 TaxID=2903629 RepID=UPI00214ACC91|nr:hypothetical protein [Streptomyces sp. NBC_00162]UUU42381.1 hypothetical protein JIW86_28325 [Streptomyces sp. NBC_00162]
MPGHRDVQVRGLGVVHVGEADERGQRCGHKVTLADEAARDAVVLTVPQRLVDPLSAQAVL